MSGSGPDATREIPDDAPGRERPARGELQARLMHAEWRATLGILAGNLVHDFNNLLTVISCGVTELLESTPETDSARRVLRDVQRAAGQASELTRDLLNFAGQAPSRSIPCELNSVAEEAVRLMRHVMPPHVQLETRLSPALLWFQGDPSQIRHVIVKLCLHARDAMAHTGTVTLSTEAKTIAGTDLSPEIASRAGRHVALTVRDSGGGMTREALEGAFGGEPGDAAGQQTGLGVAVVHSIVAAHDGWIEVDSEPGEGMGVVVNLPARTAPEPERAREVGPDTLRGTGTVLVVDGEPMIVALLRTALESRGYQVLTANVPGEALALFEEHHRMIVAVVLDPNLPELERRPILQRMREIVLDMPVVLVVGAVAGAGQPPHADANTRVVAKPFTSADVLDAVRAVSRTVE